MRKLIRKLKKIFPDRNYVRSNSFEYVKLVNQEDLSSYFTDLGLALKSEDVETVRIASQSILDKLKELAKINADITVSIGDSSKSQMGYVRMVRGKKHSIRVYSRTPKRKKMRSTKVFLNTLLHEFAHIYDWDKLRLSNSIHCSGFYKRIGSLQKLFYDSSK